MANKLTGIKRLLAETNFSGSWADKAQESPREQAELQSIYERAGQQMETRTTRKGKTPTPSSSGFSTQEVRGRIGAKEFREIEGRNPTSYIRSRRRRHGRQSRKPSSLVNMRAQTSGPVRYFPPPEHRAFLQQQGNQPPNPRQETAPGPRPRPGKFMRECRANSDEGGCPRHKSTHNCKFIHRDEPEWGMLREDQKKKGGGVPPLSSVNTYTSWPGGVDPTSKLYSQAPKL
jgi:hypothetical protein